MVYKVLDTREISQLSPTGTERKFYRVWLQTGKGAQGTLDVAPEHWTEERLPELLQEKADELDLGFRLSEQWG